MPATLIGLMYQSWSDLDQSVSGLTTEEATARYDGGSSIAWTMARVTHQVDSWLVVRFQSLAPHSIISDSVFRTGGSGKANNWPLIQAGVREVRSAARRLLDTNPLPDLDRVIPYDGSIEYLRPIGLSLRYALMRIAAHHFVHVGEIATVRSRLGQEIDFPDWGQDLV